MICIESSEAGMAGRRGGIASACLLAVLAVLMPCPTRGCDNPVYRYAIERWKADDYRLVAPASAQARLRQELDTLASRGPRPNLSLLDPAKAKALGRQPEPDRMVLLSPAGGFRSAGRDAVWSGTPAAESLARIVDSPARREIARRLLAGEAIVWVVVERGQPVGDEDLKRLDALIADYGRKIAEMDAAAENDLPSDEEPIDKSAFWPPRISVLRVRADDPEERVLVAMLNASAATEETEGATVFPLFGRGRVLGGIAFDKLDAKEFDSACDFLTGACSCEVKEMNPGDDLLIVADWESLPKLARAGNGAADTEVEEGDGAAPQAVANGPQNEPPAAAANAPSAAGRTTFPVAFWLAAAAGVLMCLAFLARTGRRAASS
jgi:hypothetical protein